MEPGPISPMHPTPTPVAPSRDPDWHACLLRTRSAVLNTLVGVGLSIAVSGWLLRGRAETWQPRPATVWKETLTGGLIVLGMASYLSLRIMGQRARLPTRRATFGVLLVSFDSGPDRRGDSSPWFRLRLDGRPSARRGDSVLGGSAGAGIFVVATPS